MQSITENRVQLSADIPMNGWDKKSPVKIEIESTDRKFLLRLVEWLEKYPKVEEGSTSVRFCNRPAGATP